MVRQHQTHSILNLGSTKDEKQMIKKRRLHTLYYKFADFLSAMVAWALFFAYRRYLESGSLGAEIFNDANFWYGIALIPVGWICFYGVFDQYKDIYRLSRLATLMPGRYAKAEVSTGYLGPEEVFAYRTPAAQFPPPQPEGAAKPEVTRSDDDSQGGNDVTAVF